LVYPIEKFSPAWFFDHHVMATTESSVSIRLPDELTLEGEANIPDRSSGVVIFAHGSGSSRYSPRNQYVARTLNQAGIATLLFDLLTAEEERADAGTRHRRFDIPFLANRLVLVTRWARDAGVLSQMPTGYFGSSTGAAAAIVAATRMEKDLDAIVSRGGRPDLANGNALQVLRVPTLLIVGGADSQVIELNQAAYDKLSCAKELRIVPGASHLFEELGALERVAEMAVTWFAIHFQSASRQAV
jgi:dienelactone hydrolase